MQSTRRRATGANVNSEIDPQIALACKGAVEKLKIWCTFPADSRTIRTSIVAKDTVDESGATIELICQLVGIRIIASHCHGRRANLSVILLHRKSNKDHMWLYLMGARCYQEKGGSAVSIVVHRGLDNAASPSTGGTAFDGRVDSESDLA